MKENMEFSVEDIKELIDALNRNNISRLKVGKGDYSLELESVRAGQAAAAAVPAHAQLAQAAPAPQQPDEPAYAGDVVKSPIVGTFYAAPAPDKDPYVKVGSAVKAGDVLFIIESMKLMNEVQSEYSGTVTEILVENGQGVEYGQPILCISQANANSK